MIAAHIPPMKDLRQVIVYKAKGLAASGGLAPYTVHVEINVGHDGLF